MAPNEPCGCLFSLVRFLRRLGRAAAAEHPLPYRRRDYLLTKAERSFYGVLCDASGEAYRIFAKVRLADLLWMPKGTADRQQHSNRIQAKHVDFVLCDRASVGPVLAIELDDASHGRADRQRRDAFVDQCLRDAGLPLLRVPVRSAYDVAAVRAQIAEQIARSQAPAG